MKLKYVGASFLPGVPARDLTDDEVQLYGGEKVLVASGLYEKDSEPANKKADKKEGE